MNPPMMIQCHHQVGPIRAGRNEWNHVGWRHAKRFHRNECSRSFAVSPQPICEYERKQWYLLLHFHCTSTCRKREKAARGSSVLNNRAPPSFYSFPFPHTYHIQFMEITRQLAKSPSFLHSHRITVFTIISAPHCSIEMRLVINQQRCSRLTDVSIDGTAVEGI